MAAFHCTLYRLLGPATLYSQFCSSYPPWSGSGEYNGILPYLLYSIGALYYSALLFINIYCTVLYLQVGTVLYCTVLYLELGKSTTVLLSR